MEYQNKIEELPGIDEKSGIESKVKSDWKFPSAKSVIIGAGILSVSAAGIYICAKTFFDMGKIITEYLNNFNQYLY